MPNAFTEKYLSSSLETVKNALEKHPTRTEYDTYVRGHRDLGLPCAATISRKIGWRDDEQCSEGHIYGALEYVSDQLQKVFTRKQYDDYRKAHPELDLPCSNTIQNKIGWNNAKRNIGIELYKPSVPKKYSEDEMFISLRYVSDMLGKTPGVKEYNDYRKSHPELDMPCAATIIDSIGWNNAKEMLGLVNESSLKQYSEDDMLAAVRHVSERFGKSPTIEEYVEYRNSHPEMNIPHSHLIIKKIGWNRAKNTLGLDQRNVHYSDDELFIALRYVTDKLGKSPTSAEYSKYRKMHPELDIPSSDVISEKIGWNDAKKQLGIEFSKSIRNEDPDGRYSENHAVESVMYVSEELGRSPSITEYENFKGEHPELDLMRAESIVKKFGWNSIKESAGLEKITAGHRNIESDGRCSEEHAFSSLAYVADELGYSPSTDEFDVYRKSHPELDILSSDSIRKIFGTWNKGKEYFNMETRAGGNVSEDEMIDSVIKAYNRLRHIPSIKEYSTLYKETPELGLIGIDAIRSRKGLWSDAIEIINEMQKKKIFNYLFKHGIPSRQQYSNARREYPEAMLPNYDDAIAEYEKSTEKKD